MPDGAAGRRLVLDAEVHADTPDAARLSIMLFDGSWHVTLGWAHPGDRSWHTVRVEQEVAAETGRARIYLRDGFQSDQPGARAHFDALSLRVE